MYIPRYTSARINYISKFTINIKIQTTKFDMSVFFFFFFLNKLLHINAFFHRQNTLRITVDKYEASSSYSRGKTNFYFLLFLNFFFTNIPTRLHQTITLHYLMFPLYRLIFTRVDSSYPEMCNHLPAK